MNKSHRVIWSVVRNCFIVASETAKAKGKPSSTRKAIATAVAALFLVPGMAAAVCITPGITPISGAEGAQCYINEDVTITSTGSISAWAATMATAAYISEAPYSSNFTNNGSITATAIATTSATAYGIGINGTVSGSIINSGTISATATSLAPSGGSAYAYGIYTNGIGVGGAIINTGTIQATANAGGTTSYGYASAYGIYVGGTVDGVINNSGIISAVANATPSDNDSVYGSAYGIYISGNLSATGSISNSGTISALANAHGTSWANAYGIHVGTVDGSISNSGSITATAISTTSAYAYGIESGNVTGIITNTGTISAVANAQVDYASANGLEISGTVSGSIINSGTISATATGGTNSYATAYGIYLSTLDALGTINNTGSITATVNGGSAANSNSAYGIYAGTLGGTLTNSGTISATAADSDDNNYNAYSIYANAGTGSIDNQVGGVLDGQVYAAGTVSLNNDGLINTRLGDSYVGGDYTQGATGVLKISALDDADYGSLYANGLVTLAEATTVRVALDQAHTLTSTSVLENVIYSDTVSGLSMGAVNVQDNNLSLNFTAVDDLANGVDLTAAATGLTTVVATVRGAGLSSAAGVGGVLDGLLVNPDAQSPEVANFLWALGGLGTAQEVTNKVAELLPLMSVNFATLNTLRMINLTVDQRLEANAGVSSGDVAFSDKHFWLKPFGSWANQDKRSGATGFDSDSYGLVFGADGQLTDTNTLGLAFAYARTDVDADMSNQKANIKSHQGALYGSHKFSDVTSLNYQVDVGYHDNEGRRSITGVGTARSDYDSWSAHAGVNLAHSVALNEQTTFTPSIRADYTRIRGENYSEKGAGAFNLNVGSDKTEQMILGADGKLVRSLSDKATVFANLGVGYDVINDRASITFAGIPGATSSFVTRGIDPSPWLMRGGLGVVGQATETLELSLRYDFEARSDFDNQTASVKARWAF